MIREAVNGLQSISSTDETRRLQADNKRLRDEVATLQKEVASMRLSIEKAPRPAQERTPAPTLQAEHIARDVLSQVGTMISARFEALEERLLPEKRLRPPLAADRRSAEPGPSSAPDPTPTSLGETWSAVVRKGKGKGKKTAPALDVQMSASISAKPKKSVAKPFATPKPPTAAVKSITVPRPPLVATGSAAVPKSGLKIRQAATGARVLELPVGVTSEAADSFAAKLREVLAGEARIARPVKCADLRLTGLDDSVTRDENASLFLETSNSQVWLNPTKYCVDMMTNLSENDTRLVAVVCYPDKDSNDDSPVLYVTYAVGLMLSIPFLIATFIVYAFIPELRNLHGMCLMAYCAGLIVAYAFLAYLKLHTGKIGVDMTGCYAIAFIVYYAFQTSFFWLNVMCFDIWRTFSSYRGSSNKRRDKKRFGLYGMYAWGVPVVLTSATIAMHFADLPDGIITPGFANKRCWFDNWLSELVYFLTPVLVLVVCNVVLFSVTAHRIRSIKQETAILKGSESARSDKLMRDKQRYGLYLKLFIVMGVNWTVEIISFSVGGSNWYWILIDISNIALGVFIFLIFVWKKKVRNLIAKKWRSVRGVPASDSAAQWATRSSSAPTEDTRVSNDETALRLKELR
ncbi:unnamed protein product, partial [Iphiclides podalirius]